MRIAIGLRELVKRCRISTTELPLPLLCNLNVIQLEFLYKIAKDAFSKTSPRLLVHRYLEPIELPLDHGTRQNDFGEPGSLRPLRPVS